MQVNSSVNNRYYTSYQTNKCVKYSAGFIQAEEGKITPNETTENPEFAEFADYQEFHKARMSQSRTNSFQYARQNDVITTASELGAVTVAETEDEGEFLGLTMVPEEGQSVTYGMRAMLSDKSTPDNPIVQVVSNLGGKKVIYNVEVNKVNPLNATQLEMFALLSYTDKMGITDGGAFGSHQQLEVYGENASSIGFCNSLSGTDAFLNERFDWASIMEKMVQVYRDAGIDKQAEECKALFDLFVKIQNGDTENSYQIGAQSFTEKENAVINDTSTLLTTESTSCMYEASNLDEDDTRYITWYTEEGILCRKAEQTEGYEWTIAFDNKEQYDKVMEFIGQFPSDWNMRFAAHENFWNDFLNNEIDMGGFMEFINGTNKGIPDFSITAGDSMYVDKDKAQ